MGCVKNITYENFPKQADENYKYQVAKTEVTKPFAQEQELAQKQERLAALNALLNMDEKGDPAVDQDADEKPKDETGKTSVLDSLHQK